MNVHCERVIGSIRREALDHILLTNESHARRALATYQRHCNTHRPHRAAAGLHPHVANPPRGPQRPRPRHRSRRLLEDPPLYRAKAVQRGTRHLPVAIAGPHSLSAVLRRETVQEHGGDGLVTSVLPPFIGGVEQGTAFLSAPTCRGRGFVRCHRRRLSHSGQGRRSRYPSPHQTDRKCAAPPGPPSLRPMRRQRPPWPADTDLRRFDLCQPACRAPGRTWSAMGRSRRPAVPSPYLRGRPRPKRQRWTRRRRHPRPRPWAPRRM
jgi:hypothetical protein